MSRKNLILSFALLSFALTGCLKAEEDGDENTGPGVNTEAAEFGEDFGTTRTEFSQTSAALTTKENVKLTFKNLDDAMDFLSDSMIVDQVADVMPVGSDESGSAECMMETPDGDMVPCDFGPPPGSFEGEGEEEFGPDGAEFPDDGFSDEEMGGDEEDMDMTELGDDVVEFLEDYVFPESQVESDENGIVVYLLDPEIFCEIGEDEPPQVSGSGGFGTPTPPRGGEPCEQECEEGQFCVDGSCYDIPEGEEIPDGEWGDGDGEEWGDDKRFEDEGDDDGDACKELLTEIPVRIRFTSKEEGAVQIALLFGDAQHNPIRFELTPVLVALEVDLGAAFATAQEVMDVLGEDEEEGSAGEEMEGAVEEEQVEFNLETLEGVLRLSLEKTGEEKMRAAFGIVEKLVVEVKADDDQYKLELGSLLIGAEVDGANETVSAEFTLEDLMATLPYEMATNMFEGEEACGGSMDMGPPPGFEGDGPDSEPEFNDFDDCGGEPEGEDEKDLEGTITLSLSGLSMAGTLNSDDESIKITGIGLGNDTTTLKLDGTTLLAIDLNANAGRVFDLTVTVDDAKNTTIEFVPSLDLSVAFNFASVADDFEDIPSWTMDETMNFNFEGASVPSITVLGEEYEEGGVRVNAGTLTVSSTAAPDETVIAEAGMCMLPSEKSDEGGENFEEEGEPEGHPLLRDLNVGECPEPGQGNSGQEIPEASSFEGSFSDPED